MFDKLIESDTVGADFKSRRRYFLISSVVVGLLFISAVVISIYAADIGLGNDSYELAALIAPVPMPAEAPEPPRNRVETQQNTQHSALPQRPENIARVDELTREMPPVSVSPNTQRVHPLGEFQIGPAVSDPPSLPGSFGAAPGSDSGAPSSTSVKNDPVLVKSDPQPDPPPAAPARPKSMGVINGFAVSLPKPPYPPTAMAINAQGKVDVQVMIDEEGKVVSAKAVSGHPLLRVVSEDAAKKARFKPTYLSNIPIKVTGVIVYNFTRN